MKTGMKTMAILLVIAFVACALGIPAHAAWWEFWKKEGVKKAAKTSVNYPANVVNESVNVVGTAAKGTADVVVDTVKVTGETLTGDVEKAPEIVATPVRESAETIKDAAVGTVEMPIKAGEKTAEQD